MKLIRLRSGNLSSVRNPQPKPERSLKSDFRYLESGIGEMTNISFLRRSVRPRKRRQCSELIVKCFGSISLQFIIRPPGAAAAPFLGGNRGRHRTFMGNRENKWQGGEDATKRFIMTEIIPVPFFLCFWPRLLSIAVSCLPFSLFMNMCNDLRKNIITV